MHRTTNDDAWMPRSHPTSYGSVGAPPVVAIARQPEQRLILAILEDTVTTFQKCIALRRCRSREFRQVEAWLASNDTTWCFSFVNICDSLDLDVRWCRDALARWRRRQETGGGRNITIGSHLFRPDSIFGRQFNVVGEDMPGNGREPIAPPRYHANRGLPLEVGCGTPSGHRIRPGRVPRAARA
jgi:hypothetical protein